VEPLQPDAQHGPVDLLQQSGGDVDDAVGRDAEEVAVVGEMMDGAQRDAVDDGGSTLWVAVLDDVCRLEEWRLPQPADGALSAVRAQDAVAEVMLVQTDLRLARRVTPHELIGYDPSSGRVGDGQGRLKRDNLALGVVSRQIDRRDGRVLPGRNAAEVDERYAESQRLP
jgi:hypothetical protein